MIFKNITFKEWSAWVMIGALALGGIFYFGLLRGMYIETQDIIPPAFPFIIFTVIVVTVSIVGHIGAALSNLKTVNEPADERDHAVRLSASHWSGNILGFGVAMALLANLIWPDGRGLFHMIFAALLLSQMSEYALQIAGYRRFGAGVKDIEGG